MKKVIEIHDAVTDPPKKSGEYMAFVEFGCCTDGYWACLMYGKDVNAWNVEIDPLTGRVNMDYKIDHVTHWTDFINPRKEAEA